LAKKEISRSLKVWAFSFSVAGIILFFYFKAPIIPIILAGIGTLILVLLQNKTRN